jgi:hypothetical protein
MFPFTLAMISSQSPFGSFCPQIGSGSLVYGPSMIFTTFMDRLKAWFHDPSNKREVALDQE